MKPADSDAPVSFESLRFLDALTLCERLAAWRECPEPVPEALDPELARRRLEAWRIQPPFDQDGQLADRLAADRLDEATWRRLAGEGPEALARRLDETPAWIRTLEAAWTCPDPPSLPRLDGAPGVPAQLVSFLPLVAPLAGQGFKRLRDGLRKLRASHPELPFDPEEAEQLLYPLLGRRLAIMLGRTLTLELHVAAHRGELAGETPEARFESFAELLRDRRKAGEILREYPVLARRVVVAVEHWAAFSLDFLTHLAEAWRELGDLFAPGEELGRLVEVRGGMGDSHRGGRSVLVLRTESGLRLVYKPRSMAVDVVFQRLLRWLGEHGAEPAFRTLKILDRTTHGFVEHVEASSCAGEAEVRRFYRRQGGYLAVLHLLNATDFHHENLIAVGEHPVLVDLEALFHPPFAAPDEDVLVGEPLLRSVLGVGLLPHRIWGDEESEGMDVSGLAAGGEQQVRDGVLDLEQAGTDQMRFVRRILNLPGSANRPKLNGEDVDLTGYVEDVLRGFTDVYRLLVAHRGHLLAADGPLAAFAECEVRMLVRPTRGYAMLLGESFHPDVLRSGLDQDRLLDRLWVGVAERPFLARLLPYERRELERIDVPSFTLRPGSRDLWTGTGERLPGFLGESGLDRARRRFLLWDEDDLRHQTWLVRTTLDSVRLFAGEAVPEGYPLPEGDAEASREALVEAARRTAQRLQELAFRERGEAWWYDYRFLGKDCWTLEPVGPSLYAGLPGIALFLAYLGAETGDAAMHGLGRSAVASWRRMFEKPFEMTAGAMSGWAGGLYVLGHLKALWDDAALDEVAEELLDRLPAAIEDDRHFDVIGGLAGSLLGLLAYHRSTGSRRALELALRCGDRLLETSSPAAPGRGWVTPMAERPLAGFSHGAAGIAWSLLDLSVASGEPRFREAACDAIVYERSLFSPEEKNWPDLRDGRQPSPEAPHGARRGFLVAWCHGAPGIGLARLLGLAHLDDPATRQEVAVAVETTLARGMGMNLSLCHGDLGQLDILLQAARALGDGDLEGRVYRLAARVLEVIERRGWPCGLPRGAEPPGLMLGLAGIGHGLLRLAAPERVPSVLALAAPVPGAYVPCRV